MNENKFKRCALLDEDNKILQVQPFSKIQVEKEVTEPVDVEKEVPILNENGEQVVNEDGSLATKTEIVQEEQLSTVTSIDYVLPKDFVEVPENAVCGQFYDVETGELTNPVLDIALLSDHALDDLAGDRNLLIQSLTAGYDAYEIDTWEAQLLEANAWIADNSTATPLIDLSLKAGESKASLITTIKNNESQFKQATGFMIHLRRKYEQIINNAVAADDRATIENARAAQKADVDYVFGGGS